MAKPIKKSGDAVAKLLDVIEKLESGSVDAKYLGAVCNALGKVLHFKRTELDFARASMAGRKGRVIIKDIILRK